MSCNDDGRVVIGRMEGKNRTLQMRSRTTRLSPAARDEKESFSESGTESSSSSSSSTSSSSSSGSSSSYSSSSSSSSCSSSSSSSASTPVDDTFRKPSSAQVGDFDDASNVKEFRRQLLRGGELSFQSQRTKNTASTAALTSLASLSTMAILTSSSASSESSQEDSDAETRRRRTKSSQQRRRGRHRQGEEREGGGGLSQGGGRGSNRLCVEEDKVFSGRKKGSTKQDNTDIDNAAPSRRSKLHGPRSRSRSRRHLKTARVKKEGGRGSLSSKSSNSAAARSRRTLGRLKVKRTSSSSKTSSSKTSSSKTYSSRSTPSYKSLFSSSVATTSSSYIVESDDEDDDKRSLLGKTSRESFLRRRRRRRQRLLRAKDTRALTYATVHGNNGRNKIEKESDPDNTANKTKRSKRRSSSSSTPSRNRGRNNNRGLKNRIRPSLDKAFSYESFSTTATPHDNDDASFSPTASAEPKTKPEKKIPVRDDENKKGHKDKSPQPKVALGSMLSPRTAFRPILEDEDERDKQQRSKTGRRVSFSSSSVGRKTRTNSQQPRYHSWQHQQLHHHQHRYRYHSVAGAGGIGGGRGFSNHGTLTFSSMGTLLVKDPRRKNVIDDDDDEEDVTRSIIRNGDALTRMGDEAGGGTLVGYYGYGYINTSSTSVASLAAMERIRRTNNPPPPPKHIQLMRWCKMFCWEGPGLRRGRFFMILSICLFFLCTVGLTALLLKHDDDSGPLTYLNGKGEDADEGLGNSNEAISGKQWKQVGKPIVGLLHGDTFGTSISLSSSGRYLAIGSPRSDGRDDIDGRTGVSDVGSLRVFGLLSRPTRTGVNSDNRSAGSAASGSSSTSSSFHKWVQMGSEIRGRNENDQMGYSVSVSGDGRRVAVGSASGQVRVLDYRAGSWQPLGNTLPGSPTKTSGEGSHTVVSLSDNGKRLAIGSWASDINGDDSGLVTVYEHVESGMFWPLSSSWVQLGSSIIGSKGDLFGISISLSSTGHRIAIGSPKHDGIAGPESGQVRVFEYFKGLGVSSVERVRGRKRTPQSTRRAQGGGRQQQVGAWLQIGQSLPDSHHYYSDEKGNGGTAGEWAGRSVSLSLDGKRVAIGSHRGNIGGEDSGIVRAYELVVDDGSSDIGYGDGSSSWTYKWTQMGTDMIGLPGSQFGSSLSLSGDGIRLAVGGQRYSGKKRNDKNIWNLRRRQGINSNEEVGMARVYEFYNGQWKQIGKSDFIGVQYREHLGNSVSLSSNGELLAVGMYGSHNYAGQVVTYYCPR